MGNSQVIAPVDKMTKAESVASTLRDFMDFAEDPKSWAKGNQELREASAKIEAGREAEQKIRKLEKLQETMSAAQRKLEGLESQIAQEKSSVTVALADIERREKAIKPLEKEMNAFIAEKDTFEKYKESALETIARQQEALDEREQEIEADKERIVELESANASLTAKIDAVRGRLE